MMKIYRKSEREIGRRMEGETKGRMREERWQSRKRTHIFICQDADIPDSEVLQVHPNLPRDPLPIPDV